MRVGILGTGDVGKALGRGFLALGNEVKMGSRDAHNPAMVSWVKEVGGKASAGTFAQAAEFGELVVLATLGAANANAIRLADGRAFHGKVVMDTTNPLDFSKGFPPTLAVGHTDSGGEEVQRLLPEARVVKAFNTVGHAHMFRPAFPDGTPDMFICGNDDAAKRTVGGICQDFGWGVIDLGGMDAARLLEPMCMVWVLHAARTNSWNHAFKMLKR